jgi:hypothetical protein
MLIYLKKKCFHSRTQNIHNNQGTTLFVGVSTKSSFIIAIIIIEATPYVFVPYLFLC